MYELNAADTKCNYGNRIENIWEYHTFYVKIRAQSTFCFRKYALDIGILATLGQIIRTINSSAISVLPAEQPL